MCFVKRLLISIVYLPRKVSINRYITHLLKSNLPNCFKKKINLLSSPSPPFVAADTLISYGTPLTTFICTSYNLGLELSLNTVVNIYALHCPSNIHTQRIHKDQDIEKDKDS